MRPSGWMMGCAIVVALGCSDDDENSGSGGSAGASGSMGSAGAAASGGSSGDGGSGGEAGHGVSGASGSSGGNGGSGGSAVCDYQLAANDLLVIEAESLPLDDSWQVSTSEPGFSGSGYIVWTGASQNNDPGVGRITARLHLGKPGRYRVHWRNRIGMGSDTTEHNDTWMRIADAAGFYGMKQVSAGESRRYPKPLCDDDTAMATIEALPAVADAGCPNGSSSDGWFKVYSSGASDWSWSTRTSDNDPHDIHFEIDAAGSVTLELSARGDHHLIDRIVVFADGVDAGVWQDLTLPETPCVP